MSTEATDNLNDAAAFDRRVRNLPLRLALNDTSDNEYGLNRVLVTWPYLTGELPYHLDVDLDPLGEGQVAIPDGGVVVRENKTRYNHSRVVAAPNWVAAIDQRTSGQLSVAISATTGGIALAVIDELRRYTRPALPQDRVEITFVHKGDRRATRNVRVIDAPEWTSVNRNYVDRVRTTTDELMAITASTVPSGRLILLHGPPGTGKTTLVRTLARAWQNWCSTLVILDPEVLLNAPDYLFDAVLSDEPDDDEDDSDQWRLFVLEDCDELLRAGAKERVGQALSRLLNVADGLVGQGLRLLVCLSTNEPVAHLHPAVRRPGRCLAEIEVPRFDRIQAAKWLGRPVTRDSASLAELYSMKSDPGQSTAAPSEPKVGLYL